MEGSHSVWINIEVELGSMFFSETNFCKLEKAFAPRTANNSKKLDHVSTSYTPSLEQEYNVPGG